jgi:P4 family phage/plasmid primase-like protien
MTTNAPFVLMDGLYGDIKNTDLHYTCDVDAFEAPSNAFEVLMQGTPCRLFIDVDGEMSADTDEATFNKTVAECEQKFCACESIIGVRNASHFKALKFEVKTENGRKTRIRKIVKKISFTLLYNKVFPTCGMIKDYAVAETLPQLQALLGDTIEITTENKENTLNLDTSVYRTNGKVRAPNAYKYEEQPERVSKIIKGSILDNLIQHIPEGCPSAPEVASRATTPKTPRVATPSVSVEPPAAPVAAVAADNSGDNELAKQLLKGLAQKRFNNYDDWFKMLLVVRQERWDYEMFDAVCAERAEGTSYNKGSNRAKFDSIKLRKEGGLTQATLWNWLRQDNKPLFDALQKQRRDFYRQLDEGLSDIEYAKMFYSVRPDRYFYSDQTEWWEIRENNKYYNTGKKIPIGITNVISECLREMLEDQRKNLNPLDEKTKDRSAALLKEYRRLGDRKPLENIASFLPKLCMVEKEDLDFKMDANTNLIAFKDCVYDLRTNTYRGIVPSDFISKTTGYNMGDHKSDTKQRKKVIAVIESVFPDKDLRDYWLKCSALSFFTNRFQMLYILTGTGGNGKGVLTSFIKAAGGDYVYGADQTFLTSVQKSGQANSCLASTDGVRIVLVSEPDNGEKNCYMNTEFMKSITGGDPINARMLFQNAKVFIPRFTVLMSCNNKPEIRKLDKAILRRLSIHPFLCSFKSKPDPANPYEKLGDSTITDLKDDAAFVREFMMYMIETAHANKDIKSIEMPEASKEAVEDYVSDNNHFKVWFEAHYKKQVEIKTKDKEELAKWRKEHTHSTGDVHKKFAAATGSRMSSSQFLGAINYNEIPYVKQGGQKWLRYYEYSEEVEEAEYEDQEIFEIEDCD